MFLEARYLTVMVSWIVVFGFGLPALETVAAIPNCVPITVGELTIGMLTAATAPCPVQRLASVPTLQVIVYVPPVPATLQLRPETGGAEQPLPIAQSATVAEIPGAATTPAGMGIWKVK